MRKILTVKTEVNSEEGEDEPEEKEGGEDEQNSSIVVKLDVDVDEDIDFNKSCLSISKYNFRSNENCKNLLNSISFRKIEILTPFKKIKGNMKNISRNEYMNFMSSGKNKDKKINNNNINNYTEDNPISLRSLRTGRI